jgi:hypothetical protein
MVSSNVWQLCGGPQPQERGRYRGGQGRNGCKKQHAQYTAGRGEMPDCGHVPHSKRAPVTAVTVSTRACKIFPQYNPEWNKLDQTDNPYL